MKKISKNSNLNAEIRRHNKRLDGTIVKANYYLLEEKVIECSQDINGRINKCTIFNKYL